MAHFITEQCTGCTLCAKKCPAQAVTGAAKTRHAISAALCIDCALCGNLCPKSAVLDAAGCVVPKIKLSQRPKACVDAELCTGCETCTGICREGCVEMTSCSAGEEFFRLAVIDQKRCSGCGLCAEVCIKQAITIAAGGLVTATA